MQQVEKPSQCSGHLRCRHVRGTGNRSMENLPPAGGDAALSANTPSLDRQPGQGSVRQRASMRTEDIEAVFNEHKTGLPLPGRLQPRDKLAVNRS